MLYALCIMLYALCIMHYALCIMLYALCFMLCAVCIMPYGKGGTCEVSGALKDLDIAIRKFLVDELGKLCRVVTQRVY